MKFIINYDKRLNMKNLIVYMALSSILIFYGCSFNPYPLSNTVDVGPPIELESSDQPAKEVETANDEVETLPEEELLPGIIVEKIDELTIKASWNLDEGKGVIIPPAELISVVRKECANNSNGHLLSFTAIEGIVNALFKCW